MPTPAPQRRLAAILAADMVGYSRLIETDEAGTVSRLKSDRQHLIDPTIAAHGGRIVRLAGDGALVEFPSAVEATQCAIDIQRGMPKRNAARGADEQIVFRIGVNTGDIIVEDDNLHGEGINVAARLESLCEPGGILISEETARYVEGKVDASLEFLQERAVKNIERPVRIWRVRLDRSLSHVGSPKTTGSGRRRTVVLPLAASFVAVLGAVVIWWFAGWMGPEVAEHGSDGRSSLAVLPFANLSSDRDHEYFADGITRDITTDLSKIPELFVISRNSAFTYKGMIVKPEEVARDLGVRYILEGSVRREGNRVRINSQLVDGVTGGHLWADRYDGEMASIFELQDEVTRRIVSALALSLTAAESISERETANVEAYDAFLQGWRHYLLQSRSDFAKAIEFFERAVELDPTYSRAYAALAATYFQSWKRFWHTDVGLLRWHDARVEAEANLRLGERRPTSLAHQVSAELLLYRKRYDEALTVAERGVALDPNDADGRVTLAFVQSLSGQSDMALATMAEAMRRNPRYPAHYLHVLGLAQFAAGSLDQAADSFERASHLNPEDRHSRRLLLATYGALGREEARDVLDAFENDPSPEKGGLNDYRTWDPITLTTTAFWYPFKHDEDAERLASGLQAADVPE